MAFWLKKFVGFLVMPLPVILISLAVGLWLCFTRPAARLGRWLIAGALVLLLLLSQPMVSRCLIDPLESAYPAIPELTPGQALPHDLASCRYIVVLGSGNSDTPGLSASSQLCISGLERLTEAVRLARILPHAQLILSGPSDGGRKPHAEVLRDAAISLGVAPERIQLIESAHDTDDEAGAVSRIVGESGVALVTSAWHMPRAAGLFRKQHVRFVACPTDYLGKATQAFDWQDLLWDTESFQRSTFAIHEYVGLLWTWLRNQR